MILLGHTCHYFVCNTVAKFGQKKSQTCLGDLAGAAGIEPTSMVLETMILTIVLRPYTTIITQVTQKQKIPGRSLGWQKRFLSDIGLSQAVLGS